MGYTLIVYIDHYAEYSTLLTTSILCPFIITNAAGMRLHEPGHPGDYTVGRQDKLRGLLLFCFCFAFHHAPSLHLAFSPPKQARSTPMRHLLLIWTVFETGCGGKKNMPEGRCLSRKMG